MNERINVCIIIILNNRQYLHICLLIHMVTDLQNYAGNYALEYLYAKVPLESFVIAEFCKVQKNRKKIV